MYRSRFRSVTQWGLCQRQFVVPAVGLVVLSIASCNSGPARVNQPGIDASGAGSAAMEMYDTNGDGKVSGAELGKAPGLKAALARLDTNGDKAVTADEISERVKKWQTMRTGLTSFAFTVTLDGSPLPGATVTIVPEAFLGDEIKPASCVTSQSGTGGPTIAKEDRPSPTTPPGVQLGLYKVKVSKIVGGKETVPARYNETTILGQEVAPDVPDVGTNRVVYALTTK